MCSYREPPYTESWLRRILYRCIHVQYVHYSLDLGGGCCFVNFMDNVFDMLAVILINRSVKHTCKVIKWPK